MELTTREIFYKAKYLNDNKCFFINYTTKFLSSDGEMLYDIFRKLPIFTKDGDDYNICKMVDIETKDDFMFWNISNEGEKEIERIKKILFNFEKI